MEIERMELLTRLKEAAQFFELNENGHAVCREGACVKTAEAGAVTAAQIFFLISSYLEEREHEDKVPEEKRSGSDKRGTADPAGKAAMKEMTDPQDEARPGEYWELAAYLKDGRVIRCRGPIGEITAGSTFVSGFIRQRVRIRDMLLFDGKRTGDALR